MQLDRENALAGYYLLIFGESGSKTTFIVLIHWTSILRLICTINNFTGFKYLFNETAGYGLFCPDIFFFGLFIPVNNILCSLDFSSHRSINLPVPIRALCRGLESFFSQGSFFTILFRKAVQKF